MLRRYDEWKLDTPDNHLKPITYCVHCEQEIYSGEYVYKVEDGHVHEDCFSDYSREVLIEAEIHISEEDI